MKNIFTPIALLCIIYSANAQNRIQLWAECYTDTAVGQAFPNGMTTDSEGNTYTVGYINEPYPNFYNKHYFLIKYNAAGVQQWAKAYPAPATFDSTNYDVGKKMCVDNKGNIYVTGYRYDTVCNICTIETKHQYLFVIKYDTNGNVKWVRDFDGPRQTLQTPVDIIVDTVAGLVYVAGSETRYNASTGDYTNKLIAIKMEVWGKKDWLVKMPSAFGNAIAFDKQNNVIVAGALDDRNIYQLQKPFVVKYNSNGDTLWTATFAENGKNGQNYFAATDSAGNIYVNGQTDTLAFYNNPRVVTYKYNPAGKLIWFKKEADHTTTLPDIYGSFVIDAKGFSYVACSVELNPSTGSSQQWNISKYNKSGVKAFTTSFTGGYAGGNKPAGIKLDAGGNIFATGYAVAKNGDYQYATIRLTSAGVQNWVKYYRNTPRNSNNFPCGLSLDAAGNVYVSGNSTGGICTVKYGVVVTGPAVADVIKPATTLLIYPNPASYLVTAQLNTLNNTKYNCNIYNMLGQLVAKDVLQASKGMAIKTFNVQRLPAGIYLLQVNGGATTYTQKFVKQ